MIKHLLKKYEELWIEYVKSASTKYWSQSNLLLSTTVCFIAVQPIACGLPRVDGWSSCRPDQSGRVGPSQHEKVSGWRSCEEWAIMSSVPIMTGLQGGRGGTTSLTQMWPLSDITQVLAVDREQFLSGENCLLYTHKGMLFIFVFEHMWNF